jgi:hypothetical protein
MDILTATAGALLANFLTVALIYGMWRLTKNERDLPAILICLAPLGFGALVFLAVSP